MVEISIIINHNYCYCPLLRCRVWQSTTGSSSANIGCSRKLVSFFKLELCSKNIFSHLCSHKFVQVRKYFLEFCSENTYPQLCSHEAASSCYDCWKDTSTEDRLFFYDLELELCQRRKYLNIMIMSQSEVKFMCVDQRCNDFQPENTICE